ncbi:putative protein serine/threonine kinase [Heterostelium album PN500]|uniref:Uncharacterized protein n=1 Tax=Heterostelium pallidum (strain ATCC 26659 / Pp 5 / PN500) TaxID=670386 RepID=D3BCN9_HETP5|nr:putative protein serine/threonine kinase [Heterostelium album PN500]EFA80681.1 putative protein serine/threonine kinase [Heterostelium album PN500]|eukprot:XP_020432801.1 putative protein serine/threonine kinase [Heterostelium album PN500]
MEPKYYTVDSKKPKPHPRLQNLLSFFEASSSSSSLNGGGGDSAKRTPPALPPRLYHSATTSDFNSSSSGNIDHTNTNSNNNNNPSSDHHNNLELTSPPPTPPPPSSTIGSGSPSTHDLMSARTMITDPVAVQMLDKLNRELQQERSAHLQSRNRIRVLEEENRQIREQNSRLQSRLSKVWQHYNSFQKVMAETYNSNSNNNSNFDSQSDYSVSPPLHSSNGSNSFNNNNSSNNINNSNNSSSSGIYQVARPLGGFNQPHTRSKSNTVSGDYKHFTNSLLQNGSVNSNSSFLLNNSNGSVNNATNNGNNNNNNNNSNNGGNAINNGNSSTRSKSMSVSHMSLSGGSPPNSQLLNTSTGYLQELVDQNSTVGDDASQSHFTEDDYARMLDKRRGIAYQILKTEKEYASHLQLIVEEFLNPMRIESYQSSNPFVTTLHVKQLFGDVEVILGSSGLLIEDLEKVLNNTSNLGLGEVFLKICDYFKLYSPYVKNYYSSISILNKLKEESHKFQAFIHEKEQKLESTNFTDLGSLLVLPLSRIGQYTPMLFEMYMSTPKSHADFDLFKNAVSKMKSIVDYVKEKSREYESQNKVRIIQNLLIGKFNNLNEPHRRYVREGLLTEILARNSGNQLHCFLFNDMFLVSSPIVKKQQTHYVFKKDIRLAEAEVTIVSDQDEKPLFQISFTSQLSQSGSDSPSSNITANSVLNGIINGGPISGGGSSSGADNESRETLTFCADSVRDREEWVQALAHYISQEKKKQANRRPEESTIENRGGEIDFKNSDIQLCEQIGSGGSGCTVHRCTVDGFTCAVKVLKLKNTQSFLIDQFVSEINIMEQLNHQNIAKHHLEAQCAVPHDRSDLDGAGNRQGSRVFAQPEAAHHPS